MPPSQPWPHYLDPDTAVMMKSTVPVGNDATHFGDARRTPTRPPTPGRIQPGIPEARSRGRGLHAPRSDRHRIHRPSCRSHAPTHLPTAAPRWTRRRCSRTSKRRNSSSMPRTPSLPPNWRSSMRWRTSANRPEPRSAMSPPAWGWTPGSPSHFCVPGPGMADRAFPRTRRLCFTRAVPMAPPRGSSQPPSM